MQATPVHHITPQIHHGLKAKQAIFSQLPPRPASYFSGLILAATCVYSDIIFSSLSNDNLTGFPRD